MWIFFCRYYEIFTLPGKDFNAWLASIGLEQFTDCLASVSIANIAELTGAKLVALGLPGPEADRLAQHIQWLQYGNGRASLSRQSSLPEEFLCPITRDIMRFPVRCQDGFIYEEVAIKGRVLKCTSIWLSFS